MADDISSQPVQPASVAKQPNALWSAVKGDLHVNVSGIAMAVSSAVICACNVLAVWDPQYASQLQATSKELTEFVIAAGTYLFASSKAKQQL